MPDCPWSITNGRPIRRSEIGKIGTHQNIGQSDACTVRFRFVCGRHAVCQINRCIHNSTADGEHLAATVTRAQCRKQTGGKGVRGGSAVGQPTSLPIVGRLTSTPAASAQRVCAGHAARSALQMASVRTRRATGD